MVYTISLFMDADLDSFTNYGPILEELVASFSVKEGGAPKPDR